MAGRTVVGGAGQGIDLSDTAGAYGTGRTGQIDGRRFAAVRRERQNIVRT